MKTHSNTVRLFAEALEGRDLPSAAVAIQSVPNDPSYGSQWGLSNIGAAAAWDVTTGTGSTLVAVIDTGADAGNVDLAPDLVAGKGYNFVAKSGSPADDNGHGTAVASVIGAAGNNGRGIAGVDWHAKIIALKFVDASGSGTTANAILALNYAVAQGARVVNMSFAGNGYDATLYSALVNARNHGVIVVAAAGNEGVNNDVTPSYPANYGLDNIISVAAIGTNNQLASFSNYGAGTVDLAAPGVGITTEARGGALANYSGTSVAAPFVTGAAELIWDYHPNWTYRQVIVAIESNVDPVAGLKGKTKTGGKLNLAKAIRAGLAAPVQAPAPAPVATPAPAAASATLNFSNTAAKAISTGSSAASTIIVSQSVAINRIAIKLNITSGLDQNLTLTLHGPAGQTITLVSRAGGGGHNFSNTVLDDYAATYVGRNAAPFTGSFKPDQALAAFKNTNAKGTWTLTVTNAKGGPTATLVNWSLLINPGAVATIKSEEVKDHYGWLSGR